MRVHRAPRPRLRVVTLSGMLVGFLIGCGDSEPKTPQSSTSDPKAASRRKENADFFSKNPPPAPGP